eukprot:11155422-Lingulodinium_polyedra.AAC.1
MPGSGTRWGSWSFWPMRKWRTSSISSLWPKTRRLIASSQTSGDATRARDIFGGLAAHAPRSPVGRCRVGPGRRRP